METSRSPLRGFLSLNSAFPAAISRPAWAAGGRSRVPSMGQDSRAEGAGPGEGGCPPVH